MISDGRQSNSFLAVLYINITVVCYVIHDALVKVVAEKISVLQIAWIENVGILVLLLAVFLPSRGLAIFHTDRLKLQLVRSVIFLLSMLLFATALKHLLLADAVALVLAYPLIVTALSVPLLGEKVGLRRWIAVCIGFIGVVVILRPGLTVIHWAAILALGAALCNGLIQITTRMLGETEDNFTTMLYAALVGAVTMSVFMPFVWITPVGFTIWLALFAMTLTTFVVAFTLFKAYQLATASFLAPFTYTDVVWAVLFGFFFFDEWPDQWTLVGAGILVIAGLYVVYREKVTGNV
jgi:drug/metabolite transporter (DMT)-like permease